MTTVLKESWVEEVEVIPGVMNDYRHGRKIKCNCGKVFEIEFDEQSCEKCGQLYNLFGQELARTIAECEGE